MPIELQTIPRQYETDLALVRRLARRNGFVFYIEPVTFGVNKFYWGPEIRVGILQPALTMNMGASTNVTSMSFTNDALAPVAATGSIVEPTTKVEIPIPALPAMRIPPLALIPATPHRRTILRETANENPVRAALSSRVGSDELARSSIGPRPARERPLRPRPEGATARRRPRRGLRATTVSTTSSGVTHEITKGTYTQSFRLSRDGTGSLSPVVPT